ncbi:hypothetical protein QQ045_003922 [Rhodiola kirilowii]
MKADVEEYFASRGKEAAASNPKTKGFPSFSSPEDGARFRVRSRGGKGKKQIKTGAAEKSISFRAARAAVNRNRERGVPLLHLPQIQGANQVVIPSEEWNAATSKFEHALVGFVFGTKPFLGRMRGFTRVKWGDETVVKVSQLNEEIFLFKFVAEEKKVEVLSGGPWTFDNRLLILKPWSEQEEYTCGSVDALLIWIHLPRLKAHLADTIILSRLCSRLDLCSPRVHGLH